MPVQYDRGTLTRLTPSRAGWRTSTWRERDRDSEGVRYVGFPEMLQLHPCLCFATSFTLAVNHLSYTPRHIPSTCISQTPTVPQTRTAISRSSSILLPPSKRRKLNDDEPKQQLPNRESTSVPAPTESSKKVQPTPAELYRWSSASAAHSLLRSGRVRDES